MNEKFGSLEAQRFFWEIILKILCLSVKFLTLSNDCKDSPFYNRAGTSGSVPCYLE